MAHLIDTDKQICVEWIRADGRLSESEQVMPIERTNHPYIVHDAALYDNEPIVEGSKTAVRHIVLLFQSGKDPEEIALIQHLSLAQVYDAISYYYDHVDEIQRAIVNES